MTNHQNDSANKDYLRPVYISDDTPPFGYLFLGFVGGLCVSWFAFLLAVGMGWLK